MFTIFTKAWQGQNMSPGARAFLKLLQNLLWTALIAGALALAQYLNGTVAIGAAIAVLNALYKYFTAQGDTPFGAAGAMATDAIEKKLEALATTLQQQPAPASPVNVSIHTSAPIGIEKPVSAPIPSSTVPSVFEEENAPAATTTLLSTSTADPYKAPEQVPFPAMLPNSFAFGAQPAAPKPANPQYDPLADTQPRLPAVK